MAIGPVFNLLTTKLSTLLFKLFTALCTFTSLSTSDFKPAKSVFLANFYLSTSVAFFKSNFVPQLDKSISNFIWFLLGVYGSAIKLVLYNDIFFAYPAIK